MHHYLATATAGLSLESARALLEQSGYEIEYRFGHVHATWQGWEWRICLIADLAAKEVLQRQVLSPILPLSRGLSRRAWSFL